MKKIFRVIPFVYLLISLCTILSSCFPEAPDVTFVKTVFQNNYQNIQTVINYMIHSPYDSIYINVADGTMQADLETVDIEDEDVNNALILLLKKPLFGSRQYYSISKSGNTIKLLQWKYIDIGCGVAYSINETDFPNIQYGTELISLTESGWYYYVSDYNSWRTGKRPSK